MNRAVLLIVGLVVAIAASSLADTLRLEGKPFRPSASITWAATNVLPQRLAVYKAIPKTFSPEVISNAMAIGSFKLINRIPSQDRALMHFQDKRDKLDMTRFLKIAPAQGWMNYYDGRAEGESVHGVPTAEGAEKLGMDYLSRLGGNTNQVIPKPWPRTQSTVTSFDKKGGREIGKTISMRGVFLFRQIDGIEIAGNSFWVHFCNDAKPSMFELTWPTLQPLERYDTAKPDEIVSWVKSGRAVNPIPDANVVQDKPLTITRITPRYLGKIGLAPQETIYPYAQLEVIAEISGTNQVKFYLDCPIIRVPTE